MSENVVFAVVFFPSLAAVLIFFMKYLAGIMEAKAKFAQEQAYRDLAANVANAQGEIVRTLSTTGETLTDIQSRLAMLEKILKDVE